MPLVQDLLLRFRRIWSPPGPVAGQAGVPEEAGANFDDEIRDLSVELAAIDRQADDMMRAAERQAASAGEAAEAESARIVEEVRTRLPAIRAERAAARIKDRQADSDRVIAEAESRAAELRARARSRMPDLVSAVVDDVFARLMAPEEVHARIVGGS